jgi:hypothetical protein
LYLHSPVLGLEGLPPVPLVGPVGNFSAVFKELKSNNSGVPIFVIAIIKMLLFLNQ